MLKIKKKHIQVLQIMFIILMNLLSTKWNSIGILTGLAEWIVIYFFMLKKKYENAFFVLIISIATSFDVNSFVYYKEESRILYSIYMMPYVSVYLFWISIFIILRKIYKKYRNKFLENVKKNKNIHTLFRYITIIVFTGTVIGILGYILNDNNVRGTAWYLHNSLRVTIQCLAMVSIISITAILLIANPLYHVLMSNLLENFLLAMGIMALFSSLMGWHGYYGANPDILLMPLSVSLCPVLMIFPLFNKRCKNRTGYFFLTIAFCIMSVKYGSLMGSKFYIIPILVIIIYFFKAVEKQKADVIFFIIFGVSFVFLFFVSDVDTISFNEYSKWKFTQFLDLFDFSNKNLMEWYMNIGESPRYRIEEFINIFLEYLKKPMYFLFGKGNGGTITHLWGDLRWDIFLANYPEPEVLDRIYASMHESLNRLFIRHGLVGICFFTSMVCKIVKSFMRSKWAIPALIWFVFYWGGYQSWLIGAVMFVVCLYESEGCT